MKEPRQKSTRGKEPDRSVPYEPEDHDGLPRWWKAYFAAISMNGGFKGIAAATIGINRQTPGKWLEDNPDFGDLFKETMAEAMAQAAENMMKEVVRRGQEGVDEPVFYKGKKVATVRKYSDTLLMFRLNAMGQGTRQSAVSFDAARLFTDDVMNALSAEHLKRLAAGEDPLLVLAGLISTKTPE